jgi:hypothetical protein
VPDGLPEGLGRERHVELAGRGYEPWVRRAVFLLFLAALGLGLANVFGQRAASSTAPAAAADLSLTAPERLRGGLLWQGTIRVAAHRRIAKPRIVLDRGWATGMTINTVSPEAADQEGDEGGGVVLAYGELPAGQTLTVRVALQVNPTTIGSEPAGVTLRDGDADIARVARTVVVFP